MGRRVRDKGLKFRNRVLAAALALAMSSPATAEQDPPARPGLPPIGGTTERMPEVAPALQNLQQQVLEAAEQGSPAAQHILGSMYRTGQGVARDRREATRWYGLSARQGYAPAQLSLGEMYGSGGGGEVNYPYAYMWILLAARQGLPEAVDLAREIAGYMSLEQRREAEELLTECLAKASMQDC